NYRLTETQDLALVRYLEAIDAIGFGVHRTMIEQQANFLISEAYLGSNEAPPVVGKQWARRWLKKHPQFKWIKAKPLDIERKLAQEPEALRGWFDRLKGFIDNRGIQPGDTYNMDETGCRIGVAKSQYVYTKNGRQLFIPCTNNRELVTLIE